MRTLRDSVFVKLHVRDQWHVPVHLPSLFAWTTVPDTRTPVKSLEYEYKNGKLQMIGSTEKLETVQNFLESLPAPMSCPACGHVLHPQELIDRYCSTCHSELES